MVKAYLRNPDRFAGEIIGGYRLEKWVHKGNIALVYKAVHPAIGHTVACKLIPVEELRTGWEIELTKATQLGASDYVVKYVSHGTKELEGQQWLWIFWEWVDGKDLRRYAKDHPENVTLPVIEIILNNLLRVFAALKARGITHGDLHEGNILIADPDDSSVDLVPMPKIKVTDFGIGGSHNHLSPKDDYESLARICYGLLKRLDPSELQGEDRFVRDELIAFLNKEILEVNLTQGDFVREPRILFEHLSRIRSEYSRKAFSPTLEHPFDYLSCEQIGDSFELLHSLYSSRFPGSNYLTQLTNTILTGPRGCGKTTIFRNMSSITRALSGEPAQVFGDRFLGVYYHCNDLYYAFPYLKESGLSEADAKATVHYFNLAILRELIDTLSVVNSSVPGLNLSPTALSRLQEFLADEIPAYRRPPQGTDILLHIRSFAERQKIATKRWVESRYAAPQTTLGLDFLKKLCGLLRQQIGYLKDRPVFFLLDDYSIPKVSKQLQSSLSRVVFQRNAECYFKISTESVASLHPLDYDGKLLEETREYDLVDLGSYFLHATTQERSQFLVEVINNRLGLAPSMPHKDIRVILGDGLYTSYNNLASEIRENPGSIHYSGLDTVVDLCSGDVTHILRLIKDMFTGGLGELPIPHKQQDRYIRKLGADFLNRIEAAPVYGQELNQIVRAFGDVAHHQLKNLESKNEGANPPKQAFRIEMRESPLFPDTNTEAIYKALLQYAVFIRDARGKSLRGAVVPRLYLRRLLIPTFLLTFSQRDNIGLETSDFIELLTNPEEFRIRMRKKTLREGKEEAKSKEDNQGRFDI